MPSECGADRFGDSFVFSDFGSAECVRVVKKVSGDWVPTSGYYH